MPGYCTVNGKLTRASGLLCRVPRQNPVIGLTRRNETLCRCLPHRPVMGVIVPWPSPVAPGAPIASCLDRRAGVCRPAP